MNKKQIGWLFLPLLADALRGKFPHWIKCDFDKWRAVGTIVDYGHLLSVTQMRECRVCGKREMRTVKHGQI